MKYTLCITQQCNLNCGYCYIEKKNATMSLSTAARIIDFIFSNTPPEEVIDIGFFGGEPLLHFDLSRDITETVKRNPRFDEYRVVYAMVTNGTIFRDEIARFVGENQMQWCVSCDGPAGVQDRYRCFADGHSSSALVEANLRNAVQALPSVLVNSVYRPDTVECLPGVVEYFSSLGIRQMYVNADYSAAWKKKDVAALQSAFGKIGQWYIRQYLQGTPHFVSFIDTKITVILRGGYQPAESCRMGRGEYAFSPEGVIYPCERLIGAGDRNQHCIGHISEGIHEEKIENLVDSLRGGGEKCAICSLKDYCMNWCGCSNFFSSGRYNRVSPFLCASEQAALRIAGEVLDRCERELGATFVEHFAGSPDVNAAAGKRGETCEPSPAPTGGIHVTPGSTRENRV